MRPLSSGARDRSMARMPPPNATVAALDAIPRLGWVATPTPVSPVAGLAEQAGIGALWVKRDDLAGPLHGSTKTRKLDYLLAAPPWNDAPRWASLGAIGSGHLAALVAAGRALGHQVDAHVFWEPLTRGVADNLAFTAAGSRVLRYAGGPLGLAARHPRLFAARTIDGAAVIPAGGTCAAGNVGTVRAGLELAAQVCAGTLPAPRRLYVALGSGGTAVGLSVGLAMGGLTTELHAVAVVPRPVTGALRLGVLRRQLVGHLAAQGVAVPPPRPIRIRRGYLGPGYGIPTAASVAAADRLRAAGLPAEDVYTGKAFACLWDDGPELAGENVLFWMTARSDDGSVPTGPHGAARGREWRGALPRRLARRLDDAAVGAALVGSVGRK